MTNKDITNLMYANNEVDALYMGVNLVWQRESGEVQDPDNYIPKYYISGRFIDETPEDYLRLYCDNKPNSDAQSNAVINIGDYVDKQTMIFDLSEEVFVLSNDYTENLKISIAGLFYNEYLRNVYKFPVSNDLIKINNLFRSASNLESIDFGDADFSNVVYANGIFEPYWSLSEGYKSFDKLKTIKGDIKGIKFDLNFRYLSALTNASAMVFINGLAVVGETKTITFYRNTYDTLTEEQIALATSKGWTVVRS